MLNQQTLAYPVRFHVVIKYLGFVFLVSTAFLLVPFIASIAWLEFKETLRYGIIGALFGVIGLSTLAIPRPKHLQSNEAFMIVALSFVLGSLAMVYPTMGAGLNFLDAWFESVSGLTTTGLSVARLDLIETQTFFFARSWMQWYGGLGIIVFSLSLAFLPGSISRKFIKQVAYKDDHIENSKVFARKILIIYSIITLLGVIVLKCLGLNLIEAFELGFSSVSTGGFSPYPDSIASLSLTLKSVIIFIGFLGALSFPLFWLVNFKSIRNLIADVQLRGLILCILSFTLFVILLDRSNWFDSLLNVVTIQTTTGFSSFEHTNFTAGTKFFLLGSMLIGGSTLSTAGGIKILRFVIILQALRLLFFRTSLTKSTVDSEKQTPEMMNCLSVFALYVLVVFFSTLVFIALGYPTLDSLFEVISATGTVGVSSGITSASLPAILKIVLGIDMLLGRLEVVTLLIILYPKTLVGRRIKT